MDGSQSFCQDQECDGIKHCYDGSDEMDCNWSEKLPDFNSERPPMTIKLPGSDCKFKCKKCDQCLPSITQVCDGRVDCLDGSDELNCSESFDCCDSKQTSIPAFLKCDGKCDCPDGSDELWCSNQGIINTT